MATKINGNENRLKNPRAVADRFAKSKPKFVTFFYVNFSYIDAQRNKNKTDEKVSSNTKHHHFAKIYNWFYAAKHQGTKPSHCCYGCVKAWD